MKAGQGILIVALNLGCDSSTGTVLQCEEGSCSNRAESNKSANPNLFRENPRQGDQIGEGVARTPKLRSSDINADSKISVTTDASRVEQAVDGLRQAQGSEQEPEKSILKPSATKKKLSAKTLRRMKISLSKPQVEGPMEANLIYRIVRAHMNEIRACYKEGLQRDEELSGKLDFRFTIFQTGWVKGKVEEKNSFVDNGVANCIANIIPRWRFPKPTSEGLVNVTFPMELSLR